MNDQRNEVSWTENVWIVGVSMLVVGLIVGFLVGWFWQQSLIGGDVLDNGQVNNNATTSTSTNTAVPLPETTYATLDTPAFVSVDDQKAGGLVFIKKAEAQKPTWLAVRESTDGVIGNILGAAMVTGATEDIPVTLLRATKAGEKYAVFMYQDDGNGQFDFKKDLLVMQNSKPVAAMFSAQ